MALGPDHVRATHRSAEGVSATFGAVGGRGIAGAARREGHALRAVVRGAAGVGHLELGARHRARREGVRLRRHGRAQRRHRGADGAGRLHAACRTCSTASTTRSRRFRREPQPEEMVAGLGSRFFVTETAIKVFSVGYPIQAPLDAFLDAAARARADRRQCRAHRRPAARGRRAHRRQPRDAGRQLQYVIAVALIDGTRLVRRQPFVRADEGSAGARRRSSACSSSPIAR